ncbi:LexA family protein [Cerasicoccus fimbriatus]|uniref:LexA family protein n=1 Tax=Cerasicoccus fimbriatus TaxID=3014554 RepID=UPI0022B5C70D|nr:GntR family transcriptional regulator [Cerasicoccus sp. TK19100]
MISPEIAVEFLTRYKALLSEFSENPASLEEWVDARDEMHAQLPTLNQAELAAFEDDEMVAAIIKAVRGQFCYLKTYRDHDAFLHMESGQCYAAQSLTTPLEEMLAYDSLVETCLIPFAGHMICDGLLRPTSVLLGKNYSKSFRADYQKAKKSGALIWSLDDAKQAPKAKKKPATSQQAILTDKHGQYLAFIYYYIKVQRKAPAEKDLQDYFEVTAPTVREMLQRLETGGYLKRTPGQARSIQLLVDREAIPDLD